MKHLTIAAGLMALAAPAFAQDLQGDPASGEELFARQCVACHVVVDADGETLAGRNAQTGPNLYAIAGRTLGSIEDFNYGDALVELGEAGEVWTEANFVGYVQEPTPWLREMLDDRRARGKMAFQVRSEDDAYDIYAFLHSLAPPAEEAAAE